MACASLLSSVLVSPGPELTWGFLQSVPLPRAPFPVSLPLLSQQLFGQTCLGPPPLSFRFHLSSFSFSLLVASPFSFSLSSFLPFPSHFLPPLVTFLFSVCYLCKRTFSIWVSQIGNSWGPMTVRKGSTLITSSLSFTELLGKSSDHESQGQNLTEGYRLPWF